MKSVALSLVVAAVLSLGAATASADAPRETNRMAAVLASAQDAQARATQHKQNAAQHRTAARKSQEMAAHCLRIAESNMKHGFPYQAGLMRAKAEQHLADARASLAAAQREEALAAHWQAEARAKMAQYQQGFVLTPKAAAPHKGPSRS